MSEFRVFIRSEAAQETEIIGTNPLQALQVECLWMCMQAPQLMRSETKHRLFERVKEILNTDGVRVAACLFLRKDSIQFPYILFEGSNHKGILLIPDGREKELQKFPGSRAILGVGGVSLTADQLSTSFQDARRARMSAFCLNRNYLEFRECNNPPDPEMERAGEVLSQQLVTDRFEGAWKQIKYWLSEVQHGRASSEQFLDMVDLIVRNIIERYGNLVPEEHRRPKVEDAMNVEEYLVKLRAWIELYRSYLVKNNEMDRKIREALLYIEKNYREDLNMAMVSNHVSMNYSVFSSEFKKYTGVNFVSYLKNIRIRESKMLLERTDLKISVIAEKVGFQDAKRFMKLFRAETGVSPTEYRKNCEIHKKYGTCEV